MEIASPQSGSCLAGERQPRVLKVDTLSSGDYALFTRSGREWNLIHGPQKYFKENVFSEMNACLSSVQRIRRTGFIFYGLDAGLRLSYFFDNTPAYCPVFILERHPEILRAIMERFDLEPMLTSRRVFFFLGEDAAAQAAAFLKEHLNLFMPLQGMTFCSDEDVDFYFTASRMVSESIRQISHEMFVTAKTYIDDYYGRTSMPALTPLLAGRQGLRVLGELSTDTKVMQYAMRDCLEAFERLGCHTAFLEEGGPRVITPSYTFKAVRDFLPHVWFKINVAPKEFFPVPDNLVTIVWVQDPRAFLFDPRIPVQAKIGSHDQLLVAAQFFMRKLREAGIPDNKLHYFYCGSNPRKYYPHVLTDEERQRYTSDVSMVCYYPDVRTAYRYVSEAEAGRLCERMADEDRYDFDDFSRIFQDTQKRDGVQSFGLQGFIWVWAVLAQLALRPAYLRVLSDLTLKIYGSGWEADAVLKDKAFGEIPSGEEVSKVYAASKINVNLSHSTNNHPRVFDVIASGGFLLTRLTPEDEKPGGIGDCFQAGKEIEVFRTKKEMREKIEYYLSHDEERASIARRGYERFLREHTMEHRMSQALDIVYQGLLES